MVFTLLTSENVCFVELLVFHVSAGKDRRDSKQDGKDSDLSAFH